MIIRPGLTLLELALVLGLTAILLLTALPSLQHTRRVLAVRAARAELVSAVATARSAAILSGGAALRIDAARGLVWIERTDGSTLGAVHHIGARHNVVLEADRSQLVLKYDALGIGRLANAAIRVRRGDVSAAVTVSAYGRVRQ